MTKLTMWKSDKNNLIIISKLLAHSHTMKKTHAKFQNDRYKTVRGVKLSIMPKSHEYLQTMTKEHAPFQNDRYKTV